MTEHENPNLDPNDRKIVISGIEKKGALFNITQHLWRDHFINARHPSFIQQRDAHANAFLSGDEELQEILQQIQDEKPRKSSK